jgi:hypothetical protein
MKDFRSFEKPGRFKLPAYTPYYPGNSHYSTLQLCGPGLNVLLFILLTITFQPIPSFALNISRQRRPEAYIGFRWRDVLCWAALIVLLVVLLKTQRGTAAKKDGDISVTDLLRPQKNHRSARCYSGGILQHLRPGHPLSSLKCFTMFRVTPGYWQCSRRTLQTDAMRCQGVSRHNTSHRAWRQVALKRLYFKISRSPFLSVRIGYWLYSTSL